MQTPFVKRRCAASCLAIAAILSVLISGCGTSALPPPVTITYRDSLVGAGKVIQISNNSSHHLYNVRVVGRNFGEVSSASVKATDHLAPGSYVEVGWMEFEAWVPIPGESVEVHCDDFVTPYISVIPENTEVRERGVMQLVIDPNGQIRCLYDEAVDLTSLGDPRIVRASHVEPTNDARWTANLDPVGGPTLGPFEHRSQALTAELEWLNRNWLIRSGVDPERRKANFHPFGSRRYGDQTARVEALFVFLHFPPGAIE